MALSIRDWLKLLLLPKRFYFPHMASVERLGGEPELNLLVDLFERGGSAVDVGANRGLYSFQFSRLCNHVLAFEPNPDFALFARRALPANVKVYELALGAEAGEGVLKVPVVNGVRRHREASLLYPTDQRPTIDISVEIRTLDSFSIRDLRIIKIDVEGTELAVLQGARETIARERPILIVELLAGRYRDQTGVIASIAQDFGYAAKIVGAVVLWLMRRTTCRQGAPGYRAMWFFCRYLVRLNLTRKTFRHPSLRRIAVAKRIRVHAQGLSNAQENKLGIVVAAPLALAESFGRGESRFGRFFDHDERIGCEPSARAR